VVRSGPDFKVTVSIVMTLILPAHKNVKNQGGRKGGRSEKDKRKIRRRLGKKSYAKLRQEHAKDRKAFSSMDHFP
jgi:hypothetical protein